MKTIRTLFLTFLAFFATFTAPPAKAATVHELVSSFSNRPHNPSSSLVLGPDGYFWGTTQNGGASDAGTVFKVDATTGALTTVLEFT